MFVIDFSKDWIRQSEKFAAFMWAAPIIEFIDDWLTKNQATFIAHTSGSTGTPKAITHARTAMIQSAQRTIEYLQLEKKSNLLLAIPAANIGGKMMIVRAIVLQAKLICIEPNTKPLDEALLTNVEFAAFTPMQVFESMMQEKSKTQFSNIKNVIIGGGQISETLENTLKSLPIHIYETFGMTETVSHIALRQIAPKTASHFSVLDGIKIKTDLDQRLIITMPDQLDIISNDRVELINGTQFKWLGRTDDIANTGGVKVNLLDIENKLKNSIDCPFFIAKLADDKLGETVVIVIAQKDKKSNFDFQSISKFERPRKLLLVKEFIYTATNKLIKNMDAYKDIVSLEKP